VRIERIGRDTLFRHVRTIGTVDIAENQLSVVNLRFSGWVEKIFVDETGVHVTKGQKLFDIYSPELVSAQEEYLLALRGADKDSPLVKSARRRLELWDLSPSQIMRVEHQDKAMRTMTIVAPQAGYILHKNIVNGARVKSGADLYRIGNLTKIWVNADVYEFDVPWIQLGQRATMELTFQQGKKYVGEVSYIYPTMNTKTRTLTVRLEFENPGLSLKPGMFATVQIEAQGKQDVLVVPSESIIHSGTRQLVFVAIDLGRYDVREVTTGVVGDQYVTEVLSGLHEGERVVTSGQFMLDSESQLHEAVQKLLQARLHAREARVRELGGDATEEHDHGSDDLGYWTCGMHPQVVSDEPGSCPICGMNLTKAQRDKQ
jgi:Cu(I)/Ag(I) efflux system membrane fusion protein